MKRSALKRRTELRSRPAKPLTRSRKPVRTEAEKAAALLWRTDLGPCTICPAEGGTCGGPVQGHHAVAKEALKRRAMWAFLWDRRNRVPVCEFRHEQETTGYKPIPRELLPGSVFEFADELGLGWYIDRHYKPTVVELDPVAASRSGSTTVGEIEAAA